MRTWQTLRTPLIGRHVHKRAYAALVLSGCYEEAGDSGRHRVQVGNVVLHEAFESASGSNSDWSSGTQYALVCPIFISIRAREGRRPGCDRSSCGDGRFGSCGSAFAVDKNNGTGVSGLAGRTSRVVGAECVRQPFRLEQGKRNFCLGPIAQFCQGIRNFTFSFSSTCPDASGLESDSNG
jgi:hypothetical protein